jgi:hypothetical protein
VAALIIVGPLSWQRARRRTGSGVFPSADGEVATGMAAYTKACCFPGQR